MSRQFATNVTTIYDVFCPVPFLPSPFGNPTVIKGVWGCQGIFDLRCFGGHNATAGGRASEQWCVVFQS